MKISSDNGNMDKIAFYTPFVSKILMSKKLIYAFLSATQS